MTLEKLALEAIDHREQLLEEFLGACASDLFKLQMTYSHGPRKINFLSQVRVEDEPTDITKFVRRFNLNESTVVASKEITSLILKELRGIKFTSAFLTQGPCGITFTRYHEKENRAQSKGYYLYSRSQPLLNGMFSGALPALAAGIISYKYASSSPSQDTIQQSIIWGLAAGFGGYFVITPGRYLANPRREQYRRRSILGKESIVKDSIRFSEQESSNLPPRFFGYEGRRITFKLGPNNNLGSQIEQWNREYQNDALFEVTIRADLHENMVYMGVIDLALQDFIIKTTRLDRFNFLETAAPIEISSSDRQWYTSAYSLDQQNYPIKAVILKEAGPRGFQPLTP